MSAKIGRIEGGLNTSGEVMNPARIVPRAILLAPTLGRRALHGPSGGRARRARREVSRRQRTAHGNGLFGAWGARLVLVTMLSAAAPRAASFRSPISSRSSKYPFPPVATRFCCEQVSRSVRHSTALEKYVGGQGQRWSLVERSLLGRVVSHANDAAMLTNFSAVSPCDSSGESDPVNDLRL